MKKAFVTGATGLLGNVVVEVFEGAGYEVVQSTIDDLDITDRDSVVKVVKEVKPDVLVNCAAYTNVEGCEGEEYEITRMVNGVALATHDVRGVLGRNPDGFVYVSRSHTNAKTRLTSDLYIGGEPWTELELFRFGEFGCY